MHKTRIQLEVFSWFLVDGSETIRNLELEKEKGKTTFTQFCLEPSQLSVPN